MKFSTCVLGLILIVAIASANASRAYKVVVLGNTGVGKSSFLNMLAGQENAFKVGDGAMSETALTSAKNFRFLGRHDGVELRLIDTQGLSDSGGDAKDMQHIKNMVESIKKEEYIDLFIICFDGPSPRFSSYAQSTVTLFRQIFPDFLQHTVLVFNKWINPNQGRMDTLRNEYQAIFRNEYNVPNVPCYFIDSNFNRAMLRDNQDGSQTVRHLHPSIQERTMSQLNGLVHHLTHKQSKCDVRSIEAKETEKERLRQEAERVRMKLQRQAEAERQRQEQIRIEHERNLARIRAEQQAAEERARAEARARAEEEARRRRPENIIKEIVHKPIEIIKNPIKKIGKIFG